MIQHFEKTIIIKAHTSSIWKALTQPALMKQWMGEPEMDIDIHTDWKVNSPVIISGFHHVKFENKGTVLQFEPDKFLKYTQLSSLSRLPDKPENYSVLEFSLAPVGDQTTTMLTITNFPTETIYKHLEFYWQTALVLMKKFVENNYNLPS